MLQRRAGNRAVVRTLHARRLQREETGLKQAAPMKTFAKDSVAFGKKASNRKKTLKEFASQLVSQANTALKTLGCPGMKHDFTDDKAAGAALFDRGPWKMWINTDKFSDRAGINAVGDLSIGEAAEIATSIWHEARHAEQYFRIARMRAAQSTKKKPAEIAKELAEGMKIDPDVALVAAGKPLESSKDNEKLLAEAKDWEAITLGFHSNYKENITNWTEEVRGALAVVRGADDSNVDPTKAHLDELVTKWTGSTTRDQFLDTHLAATEAIATKSPLDELAIKNLKAIKPALAALKTAWRGVGANWSKATDAQKLASLKGVESAFKALEVPLYAAYLEHPHERDARETGIAAGEEFRKLAKR